MEPDTVAEVWNTLLALIEQGEIKSFNYTEREFHGLESIPAALELLSTGIVWGKIVIDVSEHGKAEM
jgi:NADPH:quinone reductase